MSRLPDAVAWEILASLETMGLVGPGEQVTSKPLPGGISSDISLVTTVSGRTFCLKQALAQLKVDAFWEAPVRRNASEVRWLRTVIAWAPDHVPRVLGEDVARTMFAMEYLPPDTHPVWKAELMQGQVDDAFAAAVGRVMVEIHARSVAEPALADQFADEATFEQIRIEPYLRATSRHHPDLACQLDSLAERTLATSRALVHGDVSPKNILHGPHGPVLLDAECACWGDPAFDLAFCLNHLLLKGARRPDLRAQYLGLYGALADAYCAGVDWEPLSEFEHRCATLLPALLLARIDGKSPVEYLDIYQQTFVRRTARLMLAQPVSSIVEVAHAWSDADA